MKLNGLRSDRAISGRDRPIRIPSGKLIRNGILTIPRIVLLECRDHYIKLVKASNPPLDRDRVEPCARCNGWRLCGSDRRQVQDGSSSFADNPGDSRGASRPTAGRSDFTGGVSIGFGSSPIRLRDCTSRAGCTGQLCLTRCVSLTTSGLSSRRVAAVILVRPSDNCESSGLRPELARAVSLELPEQISTARARLLDSGIRLDPRQIDLFLLGALWCRMLTGESVVAYLRSPRVKSKVPPECCPILERALGRGGQECFTDVRQFISAFSRHCYLAADRPE